MTDSLSIHWTFPDGSTRYVGELRTRGIFRSSAASTTSTEMCDCSCRASRTARYLSGDRGVEAVVGAAALSICVHSVDDHPRNMGFLGGKDGWTVAPLFDVVPFPYEPLRGTGNTPRIGRPRPISRAPSRPRLGSEEGQGRADRRNGRADRAGRLGAGAPYLRTRRGARGAMRTIHRVRVRLRHRARRRRAPPLILKASDDEQAIARSTRNSAHSFSRIGAVATEARTVLPGQGL